MTSLERLKEVFRVKGLKGAADLNRKMGWKTTQWYTQIKNGSHGISLKKAKEIHSLFPDISEGWLVTGEGEMLISTRKHDPYVANAEPKILEEEYKCVHCQDHLLSIHDLKKDNQYLQVKIDELKVELDKVRKENSELVKESAILQYKMDLKNGQA